MPSHDRRAAARRRAWGRGPVILRFESLEGRQLMAVNAMAAKQALPDLLSTEFDTAPSADWNDTIGVNGAVANLGNAPVPPGAFAGIYASPSMVIGPGSQLVGVVAIKAGLQPGETQSFHQAVTLPPSALVGMKSTKLWLGVRIDPQGAITESNTVNNEGRGLAIDQAIVTITPKRPSNLNGASFALSTSQALWGDPINITAQITNNAQGDAPATRAKIVLTPTGEVPGGPDDVTVGNIAVPAIPSFGRVNVVQQITLPAVPPTNLLGQTSFLITMVQDADHQASLGVYAPQLQGVGLDTAAIGISLPPKNTIVQGAKPDLAATGVHAPGAPLHWGQSFQVDTTVQNIGQANAPEFKVRFLLTGLNGSTDRSLFLGEADVTSGLAAGFAQDVIQTVSLPSRLPYGFNVASLDYGRVVAIIDPENLINENLKTNNQATSAPVTLYVLNTDGTTTVPVLPPIRQNVPAPATPSTTANPANVQNPSVPIKHGSYKVPKKAKENPIIHQISSYPKKFNNFFKSLNIFSKTK